MTTEETKQDCGCDETPPKDDCGDCDTTLIDERRCKAKGVAAEAEYNASYQTELGAAQAEFNSVRDAYRTTRTGLKLQINDMRHETKRAIERIKCLIRQQRVKECLDEAWCDVKHKLDCCSKSGCCVEPDECVFPLPESDPCETDLKKLIAEYTEHTDKAKACFTALKGEAGELTKRVADRKTDLDDILTKLNANDGTTDLNRLYASAIVLRYRLSGEIIWNGFDEVRNFVDCLCRALNCWSEGAAQIAVLTNWLAVCDCKAKAQADRCDAVTKNPVDEILTVYEKKCCPDPCPPDPEDCEDDDDQDDDDHHDCDCSCHDDERGTTVGA